MDHVLPGELQKSYHILKSALKEDIGSGDITTGSTVSQRQQLHAVIIAKSAGILAGLPFFSQTFSILSRKISIFLPVEEGSATKKGTTIMEIRGRAGAILKAERTALNLLGRMSGIATKTAQFVEKVTGTSVKILDTRKTVPGLRLFDKYAVRVGGGHNHRFGLYDMYLIKENHIAAAGGIKEAVGKCVSARGAGKTLITVEVSSLSSAELATVSGADRILLDNMVPDKVETIVKKLKEMVELEVSGGITLTNVRRYADTGVDCISVGMLTHSVTAVDFSLLVK